MGNGWDDVEQFKAYPRQDLEQDADCEKCLCRNPKESAREDLDRQSQCKPSATNVATDLLAGMKRRSSAGNPDTPRNSNSSSIPQWK